MTLAKVKELDGMTQQATNLHVRPPFCELRYYGCAQTRNGYRTK